MFLLIILKHFEPFYKSFDTKLTNYFYLVLHEWAFYTVCKLFFTQIRLLKIR